MPELAAARQAGVWWRDYDQEVLADSPVSYWKLDETSGTTVTDSVGSNHGTYAGATLNQAPLINARSSVLFSGSSSGITIPYAASLSFINTAFSLGCWVKTTQAVAVRLFDKSTSGSNWPEYWIYMNASGTVTAEVRSSNADTPKVSATTTVTVNDGMRHRVFAAFVPSGTLKIYIDGVERASVTHALTSSYNNGSPLYIARRSTADYLAGNMDEVDLYASALSAARVLAHYNAGIAP